jgi:hypothetical protein
LLFSCHLSPGIAAKADEKFSASPKIWSPDEVIFLPVCVGLESLTYSARIKVSANTPTPASNSQTAI